MTGRRPVVVLDAPSNLGLRPPAPGVAPGVSKLAGALRDQRLLQRLGAADAGVVVPPRYRPDWDGRTTRNEAAIARYSSRLATRLEALLDGTAFPLVLGGDCSILLGALLAFRRRRPRTGLVFVDAHSDFRHPGNTDAVQAVAGEDLAVACGFADPPLAALEGLGPLVDPADVVLVGVRPDDAGLTEVGALGITAVTSEALIARGPAAVAADARRRLAERGLDRFWVHVDADVLDPALLPAVDSPARGGLDAAQLTTLLADLVTAPEAAGLQLTVYDPDLDESGEQAALLASILVDALRSLGGAHP